MTKASHKVVNAAGEAAFGRTPGSGPERGRRRAGPDWSMSRRAGNE
jgi:hypothetical protein